MIARLVVLTCGVAIVLCGVTPRAQSIAGNARTVLAAVVNAQGQPIVDLALDDFVVTEGSASREVLDVHVADYPLAMVLDDRAVFQDAIDAVRSSARRFIQRVGERPVALLALSEGRTPLAALDDSRETVLARLERLAPAQASDGGPLDTIARAAGLLADTGTSFSAVVVVAAGPVDASAPVRGELLPKIIESGAAVHVVQTQSNGGESGALDGENNLLQVVARQTNGQFTKIFSTASYQAAFDRLADRLAIEMMVQYLTPSGPRAGDVRVGVRIPGARVVGLGVK